MNDLIDFPVEGTIIKTYGADGYYTIIFGGTDASIVDNRLALLVIIAVSLCISLLTVWIKKEPTTI